MADDILDAVSNELVGDRNALLGVRDVVAENDLDRLAVDTASGVDVGSSLLGTLLELCAECGVRTRERAGHADEDFGVSVAAEGDHGRQRNCRKERLLHIVTPKFFVRV